MPRTDELDWSCGAAAMMPRLPQMEKGLSGEPQTIPGPAGKKSSATASTAGADRGEEGVVLVEDDEGCAYSLSLSSPSLGTSRGSVAGTGFSPASAYLRAFGSDSQGASVTLLSLSPGLSTGMTSVGSSSVATLTLDPTFFPSSPPLYPSTISTPAFAFPSVSPTSPHQPTKPSPTFAFPLVSPTPSPQQPTKPTHTLNFPFPAAYPLSSPSRLAASAFVFPPSPSVPFAPSDSGGDGGLHTATAPRLPPSLYTPLHAPHQVSVHCPPSPFGTFLLPPLPPLPRSKQHAPSAAGVRGRYRCRFCGLLKRGHICIIAPQKRGTSHDHDDDDDEEDGVETRDVATQVDFPPRKTLNHRKNDRAGRVKSMVRKATVGVGHGEAGSRAKRQKVDVIELV